ncbi:hypothetical protein [Rubrivivax gelatinosus]|uniref:hypothetical protein n=1 Tax=Rubrivivax gelatinosus TaxID=28068 RepID=UPI0012FD2472|nr:hypothetical protein [Rubrivivax gelatinosus]MBG6079827.1 hypothetical protein [Rubrivivax gelatinosus]
MESFLISLLVLVLFIERGGKLRQQLMAAIASNHRGVIKYFGSAAVLSLTLSLLPGLLLSIYMRRNGFFAYEVFGDQRQALQVLSVNVLANFLLLSVCLFSTALLWNSKVDKVSIGMSALVTLFMITLFVLFALSSGRYDLAISIFVLCLMLGGYLCFWVSSGFGEKARYWWVPLAFSVAFFLLPLAFYQSSAVLTENALFQMKVGGMDVELSEPLGFEAHKSEAVLSGKLLLRTPEFYYLRPTNNPASVLILRTEHVSLKYNDKLR